MPMPRGERTDVGVLSNRKLGMDAFLTFLRLRGVFQAHVEQLARDEAIRQIAIQDGISVPQAELQARVDSTRRVLGLFRAADTERYFRSHGIRHEDFERDVEIRGLLEALEARVDPGEVARRLEGERSLLERVKVYQIVLDGDEAADEILAQIQEGGSFHELAREHSIDPFGRDTGGFVGWIAPAALGPEVGAALLEARIGIPFGPFEGRLFLLAEREDPASESVVRRVREHVVEERIQLYLAEHWAPARQSDPRAR